MGDDSSSKGHEFESWRRILDGLDIFSHCFVVEYCLKRPKINKKEAGIGPFLKKEERIRESEITFKGGYQWHVFFKKGPVSFCSFLFFSSTNFSAKTLGVNGIRHWIVGVEGLHADHLTTTMVQTTGLLHR